MLTWTVTAVFKPKPRGGVVWRRACKVVREDVQVVTMEITTRQRDSAVVLDVVGRLTAGAGAEQLRSTIAQLADGGTTNVLLNLQEVEFMDSSGLGALAVGSDLLRRRGGHLAVVNARGPVRHVFQITRLNRVFPEFEDEDAALANFAA